MALQGAAAAACPAGMVAFADFCMDRFEAPNQAGLPPLAMRSATDGVAFCAALGKRLCSEAEWVTACKGPAGLPYPYGTTYKRSRCNDDKTWKVPSWTVLGTWPRGWAAHAIRSGFDTNLHRHSRRATAIDAAAAPLKAQTQRRRGLAPTSASRGTSATR